MITAASPAPVRARQGNPYGPPTAEEVDRFLGGDGHARGSRKSQKAREFTVRHDVPKADVISLASHFDFAWGFVAETCTDRGAVWDFGSTGKNVD